ncbi:MULTISPECIES: sensor histidine kinase [Mycobacterium]|uniref:Sensor-like histidine kinase SenX3 n=5 Tax=Mycobacteriaceae TaxID=1762 RepID=B2HQV5_MYCMM|nr:MULTISPECIES: ATP-binding protein [Mycobacterium]ULL09404.1 two-component sensor histidine kinase [Mycobacterium liflandii]ACC39275.1 two-component sensor histidine kinase SenX3 [Mycobacterium marinum M]AGC60883.1 two-component sensor histidine kinase SenX3 [Mycobacterium liflandii 128FXT]AXN42724.1 Signal-transduction histidine kinase senX3 [Mycobacterium marinum]AXN48186.1 Signal-transduction histidine kinase senX3 [Mycobacterium marinum]
MTVFSALLLAGVLSALALAAGVAVGARLSQRLVRRRQQASTEWTGITVAQMLQRIVALMPMGVAVVDSHRDVVYLNDRAKELGLVRDRQLDDQAWEAAQQALRGSDVEFDLSPGKRPGGRSGLSVHGQARLLSEEDRRFTVVFAYDQSDYARMEATRRDFVANVSHELKTPVGAMALLAEALLASADDSDTVRRFAEKVLIEANRLGDMVAELIELSRLQGAERLHNVTDVDVDTIVSEAISRHKVAADNAEIEVRTDSSSGLHVLGDQTLLVTALANLVSNAIAYSSPGSPVSISRRKRGDNVEIAVTDRGIGIALEDQERVFERFFRGDKARSRATGGSGLGLAIVKHVAANHNGSIGVWSKPGTGSTFTLSIPASSAPDDSDQPDQPRARDARPNRSQREEELSR